jgi:hypothetical protein
VSAESGSRSALAQRAGKAERPLLRDVGLEPVRESAVLPEQDVAGEERLVDVVAPVASDPEDEVGRAAKPDPCIAVHL